MRGRKILFVYVIAVVVYVTLTFFILPPDARTMMRYNLTATQLRLLNLGIVIPLILIWGAAFYGFAKMRRYADTIRSATEGRAVNYITNGVMVLALALPTTSIVNKLLGDIGRHHASLMTISTIATNYVSLVFPLVAFVLISLGANSLTGIRKQRTPRMGIHALVLLFGFISVGYTYFVVHFAFSGDSAVGSIYAMPLWLVLITLVVPYIYTWFIGVVAAYEIFVYNANLKGVIYRKSWSFVSVGLALVILSQVCVQYLTTLTRQLSQLHIGTIVSLVYGLLFVMAGGYIVLALGMKRLQRIEEV